MASRLLSSLFVATTALENKFFSSLADCNADTDVQLIQNFPDNGDCVRVNSTFGQVYASTFGWDFSTKPYEGVFLDGTRTQFCVAATKSLCDEKMSIYSGKNDPRTGGLCGPDQDCDQDGGINLNQPDVYCAWLDGGGKVANKCEALGTSGVPSISYVRAVLTNGITVVHHSTRRCDCAPVLTVDYPNDECIPVTKEIDAVWGDSLGGYEGWRLADGQWVWCHSSTKATCDNALLNPSSSIGCELWDHDSMAVNYCHKDGPTNYVQWITGSGGDTEAGGVTEAGSCAKENNIGIIIGGAAGGAALLAGLAMVFYFRSKDSSKDSSNDTAKPSTWWPAANQPRPQPQTGMSPDDLGAAASGLGAAFGTAFGAAFGTAVAQSQFAHVGSSELHTLLYMLQLCSTVSTGVPNRKSVKLCELLICENWSRYPGKVCACGAAAVNV